MAETVQMKVNAPAWERIKVYAELSDMPASQLANRLMVETLDSIDSGGPELPPIVEYLRKLKAAAKEVQAELPQAKKPGAKRPRT